MNSGTPLVRTAGGEWTLIERNGPRCVGPAKAGSLVTGLTEPPMSHDLPVVRRQVEILNSLGLHMRPADKFVKLALQFRSEIRVHHNGNEFNGKSILDLTSLGAERGTQLALEACGPDAAEAVAALADLIAARFHEDDEAIRDAEPAP